MLRTIAKRANMVQSNDEKYSAKTNVISVKNPPIRRQIKKIEESDRTSQRINISPEQNILE
jgi:hypothetical protein